MIPRWNEVTAIFGGTFNPPHLGHREAVRGLFEGPGVRRVWVVPSAIPAQKAGLVNSKHRVAMTRLAFESTPASPMPVDVTVSSIEIDRSERSGGQPSYTYETLSEIRKELNQIAFIIGTDQLANLTTWKRFPELLSLSHWIVLARMPGGMQPALTKMQEWEGSGLAQRIQGQDASPTWRLPGGSTCLTVVPTRAPAVSSTLIREEMGRTGQPPANTLLPEVSEYLKQHCLYGSGRGK